MNVLKVAKAMVLGLSMLTMTAYASDRGSKLDAMSMVNEAISHVKAVGEESAFKAFSDKGEQAWQNKDVYLFCYDRSNTNTCHGANEKLIGKNLSELKTPDGQFLIKAMNELTTSAESGWIQYDWPHPHTKKIEKKQAYIHRLPSGNGFLGAGIYQ